MRSSIAPAALLLLTLGSMTAADPSAELLALTGGRRVKVVWCQATGVDGGPLLTFDTQGSKTRTLPFTGSFAQLSHDGETVVATSRIDGKPALISVRFDGSGQKLLASGSDCFLLSLWCDAKTGREWAYVSQCWESSGQYNSKAIYRLPLDRPEQRELVWDRCESGQFFMLSHDGTRACAAFPWGKLGVLNIVYGPDGRIDQDGSQWTQYSGGCFPGIAPDDSYRFFALQGDHKHILMFDAGGSGRRDIRIDGAPGLNGQEAWLTRWSSDPRFFTMMGPEHGNSHLYMGRFDADFTKVEAWAMVNGDEVKNFLSHAWIAPLEPITPLGATPAAGLESKLLAAQLGRLAKASALKPAVDELEKLAADQDKAAESAEAKRILRHLAAWGEDRLRKAESLLGVDTPAALDAYKALASLYAGLPAGIEADAALKSPELAAELKAFPLLKRILEAEKKLKDIKAATAQDGSDKKWLAGNASAVHVMQSALKDLLKAAPASKAGGRAKDILAKHAIPAEPGK